MNGFRCCSPGDAHGVLRTKGARGDRDLLAGSAFACGSSNNPSIGGIFSDEGKGHPMTSTLALLEDEDSTLIGRALAGHGECFTVLMDRYSAALESYRRARCRPLGRPLVDRAR